MTKISVTIAEAVEMTGISRSSFYRLFGEGKLHPRKQGKRVLLLVDELNKLVEGLPVANIGGAG